MGDDQADQRSRSESDQGGLRDARRQDALCQTEQLQSKINEVGEVELNLNASASSPRDTYSDRQSSTKTGAVGRYVDLPIRSNQSPVVTIYNHPGAALCDNKDQAEHQCTQQRNERNECQAGKKQHVH